MNDKGYINIQGWQINQLGLRGNKLILYALVYGFSQDGKTEFKGSYNYVMKALGLSKATVQRLYKELLDEKKIKKTKESHYIALVPKDEGVLKMSTPTKKGVLKTSTEGTQNEYNKVLKMNTNNNTNNTLNNNIAETSSAVEVVEEIIEEANEDEKLLNIQIGEIIKEFETVNPSCKTYYGNKTQRKACTDLISIYGFEMVLGVVKYLPTSNNIFAVTKITTPSQLFHNYARLKSQLVALKTKGLSKGKTIISSTT